MESWWHNVIFRVSRKMKGDEYAKSLFLLSVGLMLFALGLYVGRGIGESLFQYRNLKMAIEKIDSERAAEPAQQIAQANPQPQPSEAPQKVQEPPVLQLPQVSQESPKEPPKENETDHETASAKTEVAKAPPKEKETDRETASVPEPFRYGIQLATAEDQVSTDKILKDLTEKGTLVYVVSKEINGKALWRICTGKFAHWKDADAFKNNLIAKKQAPAQAWVNQECASVAGKEK